MTNEKAPITDRIFRRVERLLGIDARSLGIFRISIGLLLVIDLIIRLSSLEAHYTDIGVVPRTLIYSHAEQSIHLSLHLLSGSIIWQGLLFFIALVASICLTVGYRTRLSTIICWVLTLSLHVRNPFVNNLGDWLLLDLLFWGMFLPLGARFSVDASFLKGRNQVAGPVLSLASLAILLQVVLLYFFSVDHKLSAIWHTEFTAVYYALSLDRITTSIGQYALLAPESWLELATQGTLILERWGPVIAFIPVYTSFFRSFAVIAFWSFHLGLAITMTLGIFPYICIAAWMLFIPGFIWDRAKIYTAPLSTILAKRLKHVSKRLTFSKVEKPVGEMGLLGSMIVVTSLFFMLSSNMLHIGKMSESYYDNIYRYVEPLGDAVNLKQRWNMFGPHPPTRDGWFVVAATISHQSERIDLFNGLQPVSWQRPQSISRTYINQRWRKYLEWVMNKWDPHATHFKKYLKRHFTKQGYSIDELEIFFLEEITQPNYRSTTVQRRKMDVRTRR